MSPSICSLLLNRVADAEFVKGIWIVCCDIGDNDVGNQQLLKHVYTDVPGLKNFAGSSAFSADVVERRADEIFFDSVEVDAFTSTEWANDECSHLVSACCANGPKRSSLISSPVRDGKFGPVPDETYFRCCDCLRELKMALAPFNILMRRGAVSDEKKTAALSHLLVAYQHNVWIQLYLTACQPWSERRTGQLQTRLNGTCSVIIGYISRGRLISAWSRNGRLSMGVYRSAQRRPRPASYPSTSGK
jgi:hypothetical protein